MSPLDELLEYLRSALDNPQKLLVRLGVLWWIWSSLRNALRQRSKKAEQTQPSAAEAEPEPAAEPRPASSRSTAAKAQAKVPASQAARGSASASAPAPPAAERGNAGAGSAAARGSARATVRARPAAVRGSTLPAARDAVREGVQTASAQAELAAPWERALQRSQSLRARLIGQRALRGLEPILVDEVIEPVQTALDRAKRARPQPEPENREARALVTLEILERAAAERAREPDGARLAEADAILDACHAPLRQYAEAHDLPLRGHHALAIRAPLPQAESSRQWTDQLLLVPVPEQIGTQLADYPPVVHELGRRWFFGLPQLPEQCLAGLDLAPRMRLPDPRRGYTEASVHACFGPWLPSLFSDLALALRLGAGYVAGLVQSTAADTLPTGARAEGAYLSSKPPALLRLQAALVGLTSLGQHAQAERQRQAFAAAHPALDSSYLPLADGRLMVLPSAYLLAITEHVASYLLSTPHRALGGVPLSEWPGFSQTLEDAGEQRRLAQGPLPNHADAAQLLCAVLIAWQAGQAPELALARLHEALLPRVAREAAVVAVSRREPARRARSLRDAFRDPTRLTSAIMVGAAFEPPRSRRLLRSGL